MEIQEQSFRELIEELNESQGDYLALLVKGIEQHAALQIAGRTWRALNYWRGNKRFNAVEAHIKANKGRYLSEIDGHFRGKIAKIEMGLVNLASRVADWEELDAKEKGHVLKACGLVKVFRGEEKAERGYEERLKEGKA